MDRNTFFLTLTFIVKILGVFKKKKKSGHANEASIYFGPGFYFIIVTDMTSTVVQTSFGLNALRPHCPPSPQGAGQTRGDAAWFDSQEGRYCRGHAVLSQPC